MELKIKEVAFPKVIEFNADEIKREVAEKVSFYEGLVYTDEQIGEAKKDRAKLRKFVDALEAKRKEVKAECLAPYNAFEKQMKEIVAIVNKPILMIDGQVKAFEDAQKTKKMGEIVELWERQEKPFDIALESIFNEKWLNATVKMPAVEAEITAKLEQIRSDLATLENLAFSFESTEVYKSTLNLNSAIAEGKRLADIQARKEAMLKAQAESEAQRQAAVMAEEDKQGFPEAPAEAPVADAPRTWLSFTANLTIEDALALREFFASRNIEFKAI